MLPTPPASRNPLRVAVIGGGIGGLTLALALRRREITGASFIVQPDIIKHFSTNPIGAIFPVLGAVGLVLARPSVDTRRNFLGSSLFIAGMVASAAYGIFPNLLIARGNPQFSLTVDNSSAPAFGLSTAIGWWVPGILLGIAYLTFAYRRFSGKVASEAVESGY